MADNGYPYSLDIYKTTLGKRKAEVEKIYMTLYGKDFPYWDFADKSHIMYLDRLNTKGIPVKPGLFELLDYLKENKIKIALATSTSRETATKNLEVCGVLKYFDELVCGNDVKNGKPHPEVFLTAAKKLGLDPAGCVAYEDSLTGIESAHRAGMITVMVPDFLQPTEEIKPMISKLCNTLDESIEFLKTL